MENKIKKYMDKIFELKVQNLSVQIPTKNRQNKKMLRFFKKLSWRKEKLLGKGKINANIHYFR